ncbi:hypothetical protein [Nocardioides fonticola]|uniref:hypothetical protein n=1 Tax=Nocardioides fonticola TaxID=450363 RepID=UPI0031D41731
MRGAALATGAAVFGVGRALSSSIDEAREAERVGKVTEARLKSTGHQAGITTKEIENLAAAISRKAGVDDEAVQSGQNLLLTFTKIRNEQGRGNKIFSQATRVVTDYAAGMAGTNEGLDLKSAAIQVGKALNDPVKGITALSKAGVQFTEQQKAQIKTLVESGRTLDAQKVILRELRTQFGGTAEAQATMGDKVSVAWGNIQEQLGTSLLPLLDRAERAFLKQGVPAIEHYLDVFDKQGVPAIRRFVKAARPVAEEVIPAIGSGLSTTANALEKAAPYARDLIGAFNDAPEWVKTGLALGAGGALIGRKLGAGKAVASALSKYGGATPVYVVNEGFGGLGGAAGKGLAGRGAAALATGTGGAVLAGAAAGAAIGVYVGNEYVSRIPKPDWLTNRQRDNALANNDPMRGAMDQAALDRAATSAAKARGEFVKTKDMADQLGFTLRRTSGITIDVDTSPANRKLSALEYQAAQAAQTIDTLIGLSSGGLFGGLMPAPIPPDRPSKGGRRPRVPAAPRRVSPHAAGRVAAGGGRGPTHLSATLVLPDGKVLTDLVVAELKDQEARR